MDAALRGSTPGKEAQSDGVDSRRMRLPALRPSCKLRIFPPFFCPSCKLRVSPAKTSHCDITQLKSQSDDRKVLKALSRLCRLRFLNLILKHHFQALA